MKEIDPKVIEAVRLVVEENRLPRRHFKREYCLKKRKNVKLNKIDFSLLTK